MKNILFHLKEQLNLLVCLIPANLLCLLDLVTNIHNIVRVSWTFKLLIFSPKHTILFQTGAYRGNVVKCFKIVNKGQVYQ